MTPSPEQRMLEIIEALEDRVRDLETETWKLRKDYERLAGDVVYLEGAVG